MRHHEFRFYYFTPFYDQTVTFYRDVLGFEIFHTWDRGAADRGTIFCSPTGPGFIEIEAGVQSPSILGGFYIEVDDVGKWYEELRRRGAPIVKELSTTAYGHRNFKTVDPSGMEVSFFEYFSRPPHAARQPNTR